MSPWLLLAHVVAGYLGGRVAFWLIDRRQAGPLQPAEPSTDPEGLRLFEYFMQDTGPTILREEKERA